jgi:hypothetical protein
MLRKSRKQLTTRFLQRTVLFLVTFSFCLVLFFVFGNAQQFLETTQTLILRVLAGTSMLTVLLGTALVLVELLLFFFKKRGYYLVLASLAIACILTGILYVVLSRAIMLLSGGMPFLSR